MDAPIRTIGHSSRTLEEFLALLRTHSIELVVDVRRLPGSNRHPQFNEDSLRDSLAGAGIELHRSPGLTGRRSRDHGVPDEVNQWWQHRSFHNYADHALGDGFADALAELRRSARSRQVALMCSEAVWWRCHRRIIADHLLAHGDRVLHVIDDRDVQPAQLSEGAVVGADHRVTYPAREDVGVQ